MYNTFFFVSIKQNAQRLPLKPPNMKCFHSPLCVSVTFKQSSEKGHTSCILQHTLWALCLFLKRVTRSWEAC